MIATCRRVASHGQRQSLLLVARDRHANLIEILAACSTSRRFAYRLDGGNEQREQDRDDGDYDQQLDERECAPSMDM